MGFRAVHRGTTKGPGIDTRRDIAPLSARGVYILSSSAMDEASYAGEATDDGPSPSVFTAAVCDVLREGAAGGDHGGTVSVEDLQRAVTDRLRGRLQTPTYSALQASGTMIVADRPLGPVPRGPIRRDRRRGGVAAGSRPDSTPLTWENLLPFFSDVVDEEQHRGELPRHRSDDYLVLPDAVRLLLDDTEQIRVSDDVARQVRSHSGRFPRTLRIGWPTATVRRDGVVSVGPVLTRTVELVDRGDGSTELATPGPVLPGAALVYAALEQEEAEQVLSSWSATWRRGERTLMARQAVHLIDQLGIQQPQALNPDALLDHVPGGGAADVVHNVAILFFPKEKDANVHLRKDLAEIRQNQSRIRDTALSCFLGPPLTTGSLAPASIVLPKSANSAQRRVVHSAMAMPLTVATGPPGTGKSQLIVDAVATAVAAGQTVLVSSTNKRAVDEVVERLREQQLGSIIRTGRNAQDEERRDVASFRNVRTPFSGRDARARLADETEADARVRVQMRRIVEVEHELHVLTSEYRAARSRLGAPEQWSEPRDIPASRARRLAAARLFGRWRRSRLLGSAGLPDSDGAAQCAALGDILELAQERRDLVQERNRLPDDDSLWALLDSSAERLASSSHDVLAATIAENAPHAGTLVDELLAAQGGRDWSARSRLMEAAPAWAVNVQSARSAFWVRPGMFDLVILDEAGQMPIAHALPMLFRARRALIVGDPMQLPPVRTVPSRRINWLQERHAIDPVAMENLRLDPRHHSTFHVAARAAGGSHGLTEHFRCHPDIAEFVNRRFYGSALTVLTSVDDEEPAMKWIEARGPAQRQGRSWRNDAERDRIRELIAEIRSRDTHVSIGVISPFAAQAGALEKMIGERGEPRELLHAGSVHRFQGGERDVIVLSLVRPSPWLDREMRLWNVAITRARRRLIIVGDPDQWRERAGVGADLLRSAGFSDHVERDDAGTDASLRRLLAAEDPGVRLGVPRRGRTADAILTSGQAAFVDHGPEGGDPVAHLEVMLRLRQLLASDAGVPARRVPLYDLQTGPP